MAGVKISALPALSATAPTDIYPTVQAGVTYKVSLAQMIESASSNNSVRLATTTALTATYSNGTAGVGAKLTNAGALAALTIDDVLTVVGNRILVKDQASAFQNGVYVVTTVGDAISVAWVMTRAEDYDEAAYIDQGDFFSAGAGTLNGKTQWLQVNAGPFVIGTTAINFESNLVAGAGLTKNNNSLALTIPVTVVRGGTGLTSTTINQLLYSSSNNVIAGLATANSSALITSAGGVPSLSSVLPALTTSDPVIAQGLATKFYVDSVAQGRVFKDPCVAATTGAFSATYNNGTSGVGATLTGTVMAAFAPDGVTLAVGDPVLFKDQGSSFQNGIYTTTTLGTGAVLPVFTRALYMDSAAEFKGATTFITGGAVNGGRTYTESLVVVTIGTDPVTFVQTGDATVSDQTNLIIGGNFDTNPFQRGISFVSPVTTTYIADQYYWEFTGAGAITAAKTADAPTVAQAGILVSNCLHIDVTTVDAAIAAADVYRVRYVMEGYNSAQILQRPFTLSFWVKAAKTGTHCVGFHNSGFDRYYIASYTISVADTWEKKTLTIPASPSAGTWNYTNGIGLAIDFVLAAGANFQGTGDAWTVGGDLSATSSQVNEMDNVANNFKLALIKLEPGSEATGWQVRTFQAELELCQRYYQKTFQMGTAPAQNAGDVAGKFEYSCQTAGIFLLRYQQLFPVVMRSAPTITFYNPSAANTNWRNLTTGADSGASTVVGAGGGDNSWFVGNAQAAGDNSGDRLAVQVTADASL